MRRQAANVITMLRIPLSLCLLFPMSTGLFLALYALVGITDLADGIVARRLKTQSRLGARLDSIADMVMMGAIIYKYIEAGILIAFWPWLIGIALIRLVSMTVVYFKHRLFGVRHTIASKLTGLLVYLALPFCLFISVPAVWWAVIAVALYAAAEELAINIREKTFDPDMKYVFRRRLSADIKSGRQ